MNTWKKTLRASGVALLSVAISCGLSGCAPKADSSSSRGTGVDDPTFVDETPVDAEGADTAKAAE